MTRLAIPLKKIDRAVKKLIATRRKGRAQAAIDFFCAGGAPAYSALRHCVVVDRKIADCVTAGEGCNLAPRTAVQVIFFCTAQTPCDAGARDLISSEERRAVASVGKLRKLG